MKFCVVGAGIIGLCTALELQKQFPNASVTIIAEKFNQNTTSDGAAGLIMPATHFRGPTIEITKYVHYEEILHIHISLCDTYINE